MKEKKKLRKGMLWIIISFVMVLGMMPGMSMTVWADGPTELTADILNWNGEYSVNTDVTMNGKVEIQGNTTLNIASGKTVTLDGHQIVDNVGCTLTVTGGGTLSVTGGQNEKTALSGGTGSNLIVDNATVIATGFSDANGNSGNGINEYGNITLETGTLTVIGGSGYNRGRGISGCNTLTVNGGTLNVTGGNSNGKKNSGALAIDSKSMIINGGTVIAEGGDGNALGGSGIWADLTINGGTITANGGNGNTGNGGDGFYGTNCTVTINGGTVTLNGGASSTEEKYGKGVNTSTKLILGSGVSMLSSTDNVNWIPYDGSTKTRYMKTGSYEKPAAEVTTAPTAKVNLVANGNAQELVTAGIAFGGTMQYVIGKDATNAPTDGWTTSIPTGTDAGTYYVWYKAAGDENHTDSEPACITVVISKANLTLSVSIGNWMVGEEAGTPILEGNTGNGDVRYTYAVRNSEEFTDTVPTAAGEYTLKACVAETTNFNAAEATCNFIIDEAAHQHNFGTEPRWLWLFKNGKATAEATYECICGETKTVSANVVKGEDSDNTVTYTATDKLGAADSHRFNKTYTVTYRDEDTEYEYGTTCTLTSEEASDWTVISDSAADTSGVVRAKGTKTFYFPVTENVTVKAEKNAAAQEQSARIGVLSQAGGQNQFTYKVFWSLPEGAQVKSTMIYRSKDNGFTFKTAGDLLAAPTLRSYNMKLNVRNGEFKYTAAGLTSGTCQTVMAQVVYTLKGKEYTIQTGPVNIAIE